MIDWPLADLIDDERALAWLEEHLHPEGLACPYCHSTRRWRVSRPPERRSAFPGYRCVACGRYYTMLTTTVFAGTKQRPATLLLFLRGVAKGESTSRLARELHLSRRQAHTLRQRIQYSVFATSPQTLPVAEEVEVDELYQNAGEKGKPHRDPADPPRRRGLQKRGRGTYESDRPPIFKVVERGTGRVSFRVRWHVDGVTCLEVVAQAVRRYETVVYTDEWSGYKPLSRTLEVGHKTVKHAEQEYARDEDGDGWREVHLNQAEGEGTGLRNFLRPFRGVHKQYLAWYVAVYELVRNAHQITSQALRRLTFDQTRLHLSCT